jgi:hypothetical protein
VDLEDRCAAQLEALAAGDAAAEELSGLAQRYSYVAPDDLSLAALGDLGPLVEIGAGTGYWAYRLRQLGADTGAIDQAPPDRLANRYHAPTPTWTEVIAGDHTDLADYPDRALLLCWPPLFSSLGECLTYYRGDTVAVIGDGGHRTARIQGLNAAFTKLTMLPVRALEPMPDVAATLSIWRRHSAR